ncbi:MAG: M3 family metallopeptidase [Pseudomonadales bacterium]|nr:M3 family metallopeptidase [Pseudomonadales bacterium]
MKQDNPLLQTNCLPAFKTIKPEHVKPALTSVLASNRAQLEAVLADPRNQQAPDWNSLMLPLEEGEDSLNQLWSTVSHLHAVMNTPQLRAAYNECQPLVTAFSTELGQNSALHACVQRLYARREELALDSSQQKILQDRLLDFKLAGVTLPAAEKTRFAELENRLAELATQFSNNVLDATMAWSKHITNENLLAGLSAQARQTAVTLAQSKGLDGAVLTLDAPCYLAVMSTADNQALRREMYEAFTARASELDSPTGEWDNRGVIDEILCCRAELAELLGYASYAELSLARKMAASVDRVQDFLDDLIESSLAPAKAEFEELQQFVRTEYQQDVVNAWDVSYYSEKLRQRKFNISQEELRAYFPVERVKQGLFEIIKRLYGVSISRNTRVDTWHEQVEFYDIHRDGELIAQCYLDLFSREGKRQGAWMADCRGRRLSRDRRWQLPVAYLVCNFNAPGADSPSLLTHNEVTTLFHEFGHGLHHLLTRENYLASSGINGVAWDAVELPSQLMENWCWQSQSIALISGHYQTGEVLPDAILQRLLAARNFQAGMRSVRQLEFALFDFRLHHEARVDAIRAEQAGGFLARILQQTRARTQVYPVPASNRFQNSFNHIFAGGYAAGYYSYKWAEVLSADVFSRFADAGIFDTETSTRFLDKILSKGGGRDALTLFVDFMGREPDPTALLEQEGLSRIAARADEENGKNAGI